MRVRAGVGARVLGGELVAWVSSLVMGVASASALAASSVPSNMLLTIDQNRAAMVDRIVGERGDAMLQSGAGITPDQLRAMLMQLRADQLLAASIAGTLDGVRDVIARSLVGADPINPAVLHPVSSSGESATLTKAIGDGTDDVVYTPVTPCRLVETRGTFPAVYQGDQTPAHTADPFPANGIRTYVIQGGNSVCTSQLPSGLHPAAVQLQVFGIPVGGASGDIEILPQGSTFGSTATEVYIGSIAFNTVSTTAKINTANNEISVQVRGGKANLAMDVVGYFRTPSNYGSDVASGLDATIGGGIDNSATGQYSVVSGGVFNVASGQDSSVVGGNGNAASGIDSVVLGGLFNTASGVSSIAGGGNATASGAYSVAMGENVTASGAASVAIGTAANAGAGGCFVFADSASQSATNCSANTFVARATGGVTFITSGTSQSTYNGLFVPAGGGAWVVFSDRDGKEDFQAVDSADVLAKVAAMPITTWRWKAQSGGYRHVGPMAQDFHALFGVGESERGINTVDADGVALAAIQALYLADRKRDEEDRERERKKDAQIQTLERRLEALESQRASPVATP